MNILAHLYFNNITTIFIFIEIRFEKNLAKSLQQCDNFILLSEGKIITLGNWCNAKKTAEYNRNMLSPFCRMQPGATCSKDRPEQKREGYFKRR